METTVQLMISLKTIGLETKQINLCYSQYATLTDIDRITFNYTDVQHFFDTNRSKILQKINRNLTMYQLSISPIDIELIANGVYLWKENRKIAPLFQTISYRGKKIETLQYLKSILSLGTLNWLYQQDKKNCDNKEYESLFQDLNPDVLMRLEWDQISEKDIETIINFLRRKTRFFPVVRQLLPKNDCLDIPLKEERKPKREDSIKRERTTQITYRSPYKDE